jgi:hypothetical protein
MTRSLFRRGALPELPQTPLAVHTTLGGVAAADTLAGGLAFGNQAHENAALFLFADLA